MSHPLCKNGVVIETKIMTTMTNNEQLELGFNATQSRIYGRKREARVARGQWWFSKMRAAVALNPSSSCSLLVMVVIIFVSITTPFLQRGWDKYGPSKK